MYACTHTRMCCSTPYMQGYSALHMAVEIPRPTTAPETKDHLAMVTAVLKSKVDPDLRNTDVS